MQIEMIDKLHLKVELDNNDMNLFSVSRTSFLEKNTQAKIVLRSILKNAYEQTGFDIFSKKMIVEIFPTIDNGCILLFSISPKTTGRKFKVTSLNKSYVYMTDDINNILDMAKVLPNKMLLCENSLYKYKNYFFFYFSQSFKLNKHFLLILSEYKFKKSKLPIQFLKEHAKLICKNNAISRFTGCSEK